MVHQVTWAYTNGIQPAKAVIVRYGSRCFFVAAPQARAAPGYAVGSTGPGGRRVGEGPKEDLQNKQLLAIANQILALTQAISQKPQQRHRATHKRAPLALA
jgi:hypothetical protein